MGGMRPLLHILAGRVDASLADKNALRCDKQGGVIEFIPIIKPCYLLELLASPMAATLELTHTSRHNQKRHKHPCFAS